MLIRADSSAKMGTGHIMRCFALAQGWQSKGGKAIFATTCKNEELLARIQNEGFQIAQLKKSYPSSEDWKMLLEILKEEPETWVVVDGYHFDSAYQLRVKEEGYPLMVVDDTNHLHHYYADILLNQNIDSENLSYSCEQNSRLLLGTRYVLLRREFLACKERNREIPQVARKLMVTLGGSDPNNVTLKIIHSLCKIKLSGLQVKVIAGPSHQQISSLHEASSAAPFPIEIVHNAHSMADVMAWADFAISAGGSTCWELAYMGVPYAVVILAKNQEKIAEGLDKANSAVNLGWYSSVTSDALTNCFFNLIENKEKRMELSSNGKNLVDGLGVERVQKQMMLKS
jgi:UDP-2,4-diacetamido-2,4,6-trideoxy-beta-L-altropyranose hydrolase